MRIVQHLTFAFVFLKYLLFPFAGLFGLITYCRYLLYKTGICKRYESPIPSIVVGNLKAGGTGKSPFVMMLLGNFIEQGHKLAVLSRGYGRKTKGFLEVMSSSSAEECGDEPLMIKRNFEHVPVFVCEDRVLGLNTIKENSPDVEIVILDDAFQHFKLKASVYVLLTEWSTPFYKDFPLPMGMLREFRSGAKRADIVVTTKTPTQRNENETKKHMESVGNYSTSPHFYSSIQYLEPINALSKKVVSLEIFKDKEIQLVTGIANPKPLLEYLKTKGIRFVHNEFKDHEVVSAEKLAYLTQLAVAQKTLLLTTEKDFARISSQFLENVNGGDLWYYLPIGIEVENKEDLVNLILTEIKTVIV